VNHSLIDNPNAWDAMQLLTKCQTHIWDETIAVLAPEMDSRRQVIPDHITSRVFSDPGYELIARIESRVRESWIRWDMEESA